MALFAPAEADERDTFEAMKIRLQLSVSGFFQDLQPVPRGHESLAVLMLPRKCFGKAGKSEGAKLYPAEPTGEPLAQAGDGFLERSLRAQCGTSYKARFHDQPKSLLGSERLGRVE